MTQQLLVHSVAKQFALPYEPSSITVAEALLAEMADILTMNLRFKPCELMEVPWQAPPAEEEVKESEEAKEEPKAEAGGADSRAYSLYMPVHARYTIAISCYIMHYHAISDTFKLCCQVREASHGSSLLPPEAGRDLKAITS